MAALSIRERVWNGRVPMRFTVSEPAALGAHEFLLYAHRLSYLPLYTPRILGYFARYLETASKEMPPEEWWFAFDDKPLPWNRPIGLLYDSLVGLPTGEPWTIELRIDAYPNDQILTLDASDALLQRYWTNQFKESCYIRDGNSRAVMLMPREEQEALLEAMLASAQGGFAAERARYWSLVDPLIRKADSSWNVPVRLYASAFGRPVVQKLVLAAEVVGEFLANTVPDLFPSANGAGATVQPVLHGVIVPNDAPLGELYPEAMYMDGFLHISLLSI